MPPLSLRQFLRGRQKWRASLCHLKREIPPTAARVLFKPVGNQRMCRARPSVEALDVRARVGLRLKTHVSGIVDPTFTGVDEAIPAGIFALPRANLAA